MILMFKCKMGDIIKVDYILLYIEDNEKFYNELRLVYLYNIINDKMWCIFK